MAYEFGAKSYKTNKTQTFENKADFDKHMELHSGKFVAVKLADEKKKEPEQKPVVVVPDSKK